MNAFDALLAVADHIEQRPQFYSFEKVSMPTPKDPRACILGRLGELMGMKVVNADNVAPRALGCTHHEFFNELAAIIYRQTNMPPQPMTPLMVGCLVPAALREYVTLYRHQERPAIPDEVRAIFDAPATALEVESVSQWAYVSPAWAHAVRYDLATDSYVITKAKGEMYAVV